VLHYRRKLAAALLDFDAKVQRALFEIEEAENSKISSSQF